MIWPELSRNEQRAYPQPPRREQQAIGQMQMLYVGPVHLGSRVEVCLVNPLRVPLNRNHGLTFA